MKLTDPADAILARNLRKGERSAFRSIYWKYRDPVFRLALRYLGDEQLAEDAVQDLFLKLWENRESIDSEKSLSGFLFTSLKHHVLNMIKSRKRRDLRQTEYGRELDSGGRDPEKIMLYNDYEKVFRDGLNQLPERKQMIYRLKNLDGYSNREIAVRLGVSVHTVKSQFYRASKFIREFMTTHGEL